MITQEKKKWCRIYFSNKECAIRTSIYYAEYAKEDIFVYQSFFGFDGVQYALLTKKQLLSDKNIIFVAEYKKNSND